MLKVLRHSLFLIIILAVFSTVELYGQKRFKPKIKIKPEKWYAGIYNGPLVFQGDLKKYDYLPAGNELRWGLSFKTRYNFNDKFNLQFCYLRGRLAGLSNDYKEKFISKVREVSFQGHFNMNRIIYKSLDPEYIYIYAYAGLGITSFRSIKRSIDGDILLGTQGYNNPSLTKKKPTREVCYPLGFGMQFNINRIFYHQEGMTSRLYADVIFSLSNVNTDKIDCVKDAMKSGKDKYWGILFGVTYRFGKPFRSLNYSG